MSNTLAKILGQGGGGLDVWASGKTVVQFDYVISPTDMEIYQRKTATGSGATDPYSDTTNYRCVSFDRATAIVAQPSPVSFGGGVAISTGLSFSASNPALSAGVRTSLLSVTGKGAALFYAFSRSSTVTTSQMRIELIFDGIPIVDVTFAASSGTLTGSAVFIGSLSSSNLPAFTLPINFAKSFQVFATAATAQAGNQFVIHSAHMGYQS